ncbi:MAG: hypothetical protein COA88_12905 [Kordia sp.]|nr:MAG: hypothetical protein COA88_12905 [Kordia sp.]
MTIKNSSKATDKYMVNDFENTLRRLICKIMGGSDSINYKVPTNRRTSWEEKRKIQKKKNKGVLFENRIIYYSDLFDLQTIIHINWETFSPILKDKTRFDVFFKEIGNYRNAKSHGRNLTLSQELLLEGILIDLKNLITIYHNKNEMKEDYFVEVIKINDNLGNIWDCDNLPSKNPILRIGDQYELIIEANDPKDREIEYEIFLPFREFSLKQKSSRFNFTISDEFELQFCLLQICVCTPESKYPNKVTKSIHLTILPQEENLLDH